MTETWWQPAAVAWIGQGCPLSPELQSLTQENRKKAVRHMIAAQIAHVLNAAADDIDMNRSLSEMGVDSITALQFSKWVKDTFNLSLPARTLLGGPPVQELVEMMCQFMEAYPRTGPFAIGHLSDTEVDTMLGVWLSMFIESGTESDAD